MSATVDAKKFPTKRTFKEAFQQSPGPTLHDPAPAQFAPFGVFFQAHNIPDGQSVIVTNHPKRSWFAAVKRVNGKTVVE